MPQNRKITLCAGIRLISKTEMTSEDFDKSMRNAAVHKRESVFCSSIVFTVYTFLAVLIEIWYFDKHANAEKIRQGEGKGYEDIRAGPRERGWSEENTVFCAAYAAGGSLKQEKENEDEKTNFTMAA